ncbi:MAG: beta-propeller fold lactonase family protein, partial [Acidobacteria bacterium]|nr:beta-propeller fold lactonase family protein [Acidobacteriota bacterium]
MTPVQKCMAAALAASLLAPAVWAEKRPSADYLVYVGTYTRGKSKGIYAYRFQPGSGNITPLGLAAETPNPSWITAHPNGKFLYGVSEGSGRDPNASTISAFAIDRQSGKLTFLNKVPARGAGPCHLSVDKTGKVVLA